MSKVEPNEEMITITMKQYDKLIADQEWLEALNQAGVDNWSGIEYANELFTSWQDNEDDRDSDPE